MKKIILFFIGLVIAGLIICTGIFLYRKSVEKPIVYKTETPKITDITKKTVAAGAVNPRREITIKPQVSGIVEKLYIEAGAFVKEGDPIARIKIIPNMVNLNNAEANLKKASINFEEAKKELSRQEELYKEKVISEYDYNGYVVNFKRAKEELNAAENNVQLIKEGAAKKSGQVSNIVKATVKGMVLDIPVRQGSSVIESNTFNEGTTIAIIADMNQMVFIGKVNESEVGKIKEGMEISLTIGAIPNKPFKANLEFISPKGIEKDGAIQFEVKAAVLLSKEEFIRAGYSANADIVLDSRKNVMAIPEKLIQFKGDSVFVEVETKPQIFDKRLIKLGLSDGINVELLSGLGKNDRIKIPESMEKK